MLVKMRTTMAGPSGMAQPGDTIDVAQSVAYDLIEGGFAEQLAESTETAEAPAGETESLAGAEDALAPAGEQAIVPIRRRKS